MKGILGKIWRFLSSHLLVAVCVMVVLGIVSGMWMPVELVRVFTTFNGVFSALLSFVVPLLILALVTSAIAETSNGAGRMLIWTIVLAYASTVLAGLFSFGVSDWLFPKIVSADAACGDNMEGVLSQEALAPYFDFAFPPIMDTMSALLLSFMLGMAMLKFAMPVLKGAVLELKNVVMLVINRVVIPLLPIYIYGLFAKMTASGEISMLAHVYVKVIGVMLVMFVVVLMIQYVVAGWVSHKNPFVLMQQMFPAFMMALASSSSAATLPVTMRCAEKMGAKKNVVDFVIPMCANVHLSGAAIRTLAIVVATMLMWNVPYSFPQIVGFILLFSITVLAAPGIPGGVIVAAVGMIETMLHFTPEMMALTVTLSIALDSPGTAVNVCGDGALMMIMDKIVDEKKEQEEK